MTGRASAGGPGARGRVARPAPLVVLLCAGALSLAGCGDLTQTFVFGASAPQGMEEGLSLEAVRPHVSVVATDLAVPWEIRWLPDGALLITERPGRLVRVQSPVAHGGREAASPRSAEDRPERRSLRVPEVVSRGEGGLMGLALHPDFEASRWIYLCHTYRGERGLSNRVIRFRYRRHDLRDPEVILGGMPGNSFHDGCRLEFGPDRRLYVTMGDAGAANRAQDRGSHSGKILRIGPDGSVPVDNPFGSAVYTYGHRNPQGLAWDSAGRTWATEHGPSGFSSGFDELNLIERGTNYGWPAIRGEESSAGMRAPVLHSGSESTWAPAGLAYLDGSLFFAGLRGQALYQVVLPPGMAATALDDLRGTAHFFRDLGRIRPVRVGPDGALYVGTSNRDGRGDPRDGDDRILRIDPDIFRRGAGN